MIYNLNPPGLETQFEFNIPWQDNIQRVALYFSGGLDSLALLALLAHEIAQSQRPNTPIMALTVTKHDGATDHAERLITAITQSRGLNLLHYNDIVNTPWGLESGRIGIRVFKQVKESLGPDTLIYAGINRMAPDHLRPFSQRLNIEYPDSSPNFLAPFLQLHKPQMVNLLYQLNYSEFIPLTHSCTVQAQGECGQCYSCQERRWGLGLGQIH